MKRIMWRILPMIIGIAGLAIAMVMLTSNAHAQSPQLIYMCSVTPCQNAQEFEVYDTYGNPIYSVGEYGGDAVFGDNRSVFAPGNVFNPVLVESYTDPKTYATQNHKSNTCTYPETWIFPHGVYACMTTKTWHRVLTW